MHGRSIRPNPGNKDNRNNGWQQDVREKNGSRTKDNERWLDQRSRLILRRDAVLNADGGFDGPSREIFTAFAVLINSGDNVNEY